MLSSMMPHADVDLARGAARSRSVMRPGLACGSRPVSSSTRALDGAEVAERACGGPMRRRNARCSGKSASGLSPREKSASLRAEPRARRAPAPAPRPGVIVNAPGSPGIARNVQ